MRLTSLIGALAAAFICLAGGPAANGSTIIDIDALNATGTSLLLQPGHYRLTPIGVSNGGAYDAWNGLPFITNGCDVNGKHCVDGWSNKYELSAPSFGSVLQESADKNYQTASLALADALSSSFFIQSPEFITLRVVDNPADYGDNVGGLSFSISLIPTPRTAALCVSGLVLLIAVFARTRRAGQLRAINCTPTDDR